MKTIPLTQGKFALVDDEDFERVSRHKWFARKTGGLWYAVRSVWGGEPPLQYMHAFIYGEAHGLQIDHRDGNGLNNQGANLRAATSSQNHANQRLSLRNTSGYKGVTFVAKLGKWQAQTKANRRPFYLGIYDTPEDAARAYDGAAEVLFGEFARLNFPNERGIH